MKYSPTKSPTNTGENKRKHIARVLEHGERNLEGLLLDINRESCLLLAMIGQLGSLDYNDLLKVRNELRDVRSKHEA